MLITELSLRDIELMNRKANDLAAQNIPLLEQKLGVPLEDLAIFFEVAPSKKMLDVGCGTGRYINRFIEQDMEYMGVDFSANMLAGARSVNPDQLFAQMTYHHLGFNDNSFDVIWGCCVFGGEPKRQLPATLAEMRRVLRPNGILFLILPDPGFSEESIDEEHPLFGTIYSSLWDYYEFGEVLTENKFEVIYAKRRYAFGSMTYVARK